ncbi:hypothetical protein MMC07_004342 [Pseudocyphellaria aurata]|nr:hypothetical protein [Pseudocyphellaria aurata]
MSVVAVSISADHVFSKTNKSSITLIAGLGVEGDCHAGLTVQHRSRLKIKPPPPNLRQVHLIQSELFGQVQDKMNHEDGSVLPGQLGENITTLGIDLLGLSEGTLLRFVAGEDDVGSDDVAAIRIMGLRNPCPQIEKFRKGLQEQCIVRDDERKIVARKAGVMGVAEAAGVVKPGMRILVERPESFKPLGCV